MEQHGVGCGGPELSGNGNNNDNIIVDTDKLVIREDEERAAHGHELYYPCYVNSLSSREMDSLTSICDAFLPSLHPLSSDSHVSSPAAATFYQSSASMCATPQRVGGLISKRLEHPKKWLIRIALWLLSTWIGTFILCGPSSLSPHFPFFRTFSRLSLQIREQILISWSLSFFYHLRMLFKSIKLLTLLVFFSEGDENNENLSWKAIGYCGADRYFQTQNIPLKTALINLKHPQAIAADNLRRFGFPVSVRPKDKNIKVQAKLSHPSLTIKCDAVVVGSGSGGGVVACSCKGWLQSACFRERQLLRQKQSVTS
ncbi:hypothetical protein DITRI_Ditri07aG0179200 [Diplodiscus trichospermus]